MISLFSSFPKYSIISLEDPFAEDDWNGWQEFTHKYGNEVQIVGDDIFTTNMKLISLGVERNAANAVLIKPNQIGTLTETLEAINFAQSNGLETVISHRSETDAVTPMPMIEVHMSCAVP